MSDQYLSNIIFYFAFIVVAVVVVAVVVCVFVCHCCCCFFNLCKLDCKSFAELCKFFSFKLSANKKMLNQPVVYRRYVFFIYLFIYLFIIIIIIFFFLNFQQLKIKFTFELKENNTISFFNITGTRKNSIFLP